MTKPALTPTAVNNYLKTILERDKYLNLFKIKGELSNLKYHSNGNIYFSIKDDMASINCIMFKSYVNKLNNKFKEGDQVEIEGSIYLYTKMGQYNINVKNMTYFGVGNLFVEYERLKKEYEIKGYFDTIHKKNIPKYPQAIGIVTAKTGAAIQDILTTLKRRYPLAKIYLYSALVQGTQAKKDIANKIKLANDHAICDVLIVGRGGGSIEDLWAFNEVEVVEAIWKSKIPIIASIGHETDTTLSDYVADVRAATPTAAAELSSPNVGELIENLKILKKSSITYLKNKVDASKLKLELISNDQYFQNPLITFEMQQQEMQSNILFRKQSLLNNLNMKTTNLYNQKELIDNLNPLTILSKGYSVTKTKDRYITSTHKINVGDEINITYVDGSIKATVTQKELNEENI